MQSEQGEAEIEREPVGPQNSSEVNRALQESTDSVSMDKSSRTLQLDFLVVRFFKVSLKFGIYPVPVPSPAVRGVTISGRQLWKKSSVQLFGGITAQPLLYLARCPGSSFLCSSDWEACVS
ncbi:Matrix Metalloproteinase-28 [Manis pentadactyla]|nr:Matrix Metalloproteinase-28 [Manis pentadactyla]